MRIPTQAGIDSYVSYGIIHLPLQNKNHLLHMIILHYDIPDEKAKQMLDKSLENLNKRFEKYLQKKQQEVGQIQNYIMTIDRLKNKSLEQK